ncbi:hypothetical protein EDB83DRAFT_1271951 [Lactarius deliciosus]|nr:hypothetical protein EDB83DRAFT_1271951 [Lactarius deliciosus]
MEEAASLFSPADSTLDPFGSIVGDGSDDLADRTTFLSNEPPPPEAQDANNGGSWYNDQSSHNQSQGSFHPEYSWQSSDTAGGHYDSQPRYGGLTSPSSLTYRQQSNLHEGDHSQYLALHDAGHVYNTQQHYQPSTAQVPSERRLTSQPDGGLPVDPASSTLSTRAAHAQPALDPYGPTVQQPTNVVSSPMYSEPPLSSNLDRSAGYSPYQPMSTPSVLRSGYQPYSVPANPPPPPR